MAGLPPVDILGAGRVGTSLGHLLHRAGYPVDRVTCRTLPRARRAVRTIGAGRPGAGLEAPEGRTGLLLLTLPDDRLAEAAARLAGQRRSWRGFTCLHTSGVLPSSVLRPLARRGARVLALHPLAAVPAPAVGVRRLPEAAFFLEGAPAAVRVGRRLVRAIGAHPVALDPRGKTWFHLGATLAANGTAALLGLALACFQRAGVPAREAGPALLRLVEGSLANLEAVGLPAGLTGPVVRGDVETVRRHLATLERAGEADLAACYRQLGRVLLQLVERGKPAARPPAELRRLLKVPARPGARRRSRLLGRLPSGRWRGSRRTWPPRL